MSIESYFNKKMVVTRPKYQPDEVGGREQVNEVMCEVPCRFRNLSGIESEHLSRNSDEEFIRVYAGANTDVEVLDKIRLETLSDEIILDDAEVRRVNRPETTSLEHHVELDIVFRT